MPSFGMKKDALRRGEYRNYTFRLPQHVPELSLSLTATKGCVCLYASNCSERPLPRLCQWTLLVDAEKQQSGVLTVRTSEHHFVSGLYHVGLYCVADSAFTLVCKEATGEVSASIGAAPPVSPGRVVLAAAAAHQSVATPRAGAASPRVHNHHPSGGSSSSSSSSYQPRAPPSGARSAKTQRPFIDAGILENALYARATQPRAYGGLPTAAPEPMAMGGDRDRGGSPRSSRWRDAPLAGDMHYANALGEWHRSLRDRMEASGQEPAWDFGSISTISASPRRPEPAFKSYPMPAKLRNFPPPPLPALGPRPGQQQRRAIGDMIE